jgi:glycosyltransferase involved in cell wall biosynthesis
VADDLVVIIPTADRPNLLKRTLNSLCVCKKPSIYRETIVVENGSNRSSIEVAKQFEKALSLRYIHVVIANKSNAINQVLNTLGDCLIFFSDDDVRLEPGVLEAYDRAAAGKRCGEFYGGPFGVDYVKIPPSWLNEFLPKSAKGWELGDKSQCMEEKEWFIGFNWAAFSPDLKKLGGFNTNHGPGSKINASGQETEMQKRLIQIGVKGVYVPDAKVWHFVPPERCSSRWAITRAYRWGIEEGLKYKGKPTRLLITWIKLGVKTILAYRQNNPRERFEPYFLFNYYSGIIKARMVSRLKMI